MSYDDLENLVHNVHDVPDRQPFATTIGAIRLLMQVTEREAIVEALGPYIEALKWCAGHGDFGDDGKHREGWLKVVQPLLDHSLKPLGETT